ncbi:MAG TPA: PilZ domain-containing protein [Bdellovibrionota bacterium]|jgi:hypothetical protein
MSYFPERKHPRIEFHQLPLVFSLRLPDSAPSDKPPRMEAKNISKGGLKFLCNRRFTLFDSLQIALFEKSSGKPMGSLQGRVVRVEEIDTGFGERTYGIAVEFGSIPEPVAALLPVSSPSK